MIGNDIMNITTKQFPILTDVNLFWGFLAILICVRKNEWEGLYG